MKSRIRLLSDLHLELNPKFKIHFKNHADVVILAGDIGNPFTEEYVRLLRQLSLIHSKVFIISGNHEYYNKNYTMEEIDEQIKKLCIEEDDNIHFLQMNHVVYNNIKFMGCTLWSAPKDETLYKYINDFNYITFKDYTSTHKIHKNWLENELKLKHEYYEKVCVITHHLPKENLINDEYKDNPLNSFFGSNVNTNGADISCYGHTHKSNYRRDDTIEYHCNPNGYINENISYNFDYIFEL